LESQIFGDFVVGSKGILKPKNGPKAEFVMTECTYLKSFTDTTLLPFCQMDFIHTLKEAKGGFEITHKLQISGFLSFLFGFLIGRNIAKGLPGAVEKLILMAEKK
jgi:hypothetical protein